ncbi:hypothetical protein RHGRI_008014 [Rhododendron griersonianum]|uniref:Uncharacterized protein n=1 Tax=Rhododendron griersonianum TaxID=479676 RepID=A0AAV6KZU2_9ERIC|nr:hypothetical protein RHGRI_008014 [Rhododendron griersonianum]
MNFGLRMAKMSLSVISRSEIIHNHIGMFMHSVASFKGGRFRESARFEDSNLQWPLLTSHDPVSTSAVSQ